MTPDPKKYELKGFFSITWQHRRDLLHWDLLLALALGIVAAVVPNHDAYIHELHELLVAEVGILAALLGLTVAGLAVLVSYLSAEFARLLERTSEGVAGDFWPYWYVAALTATAAVVAGGALFALEGAGDVQLRLVAGLTSFLTSYAIFAIVALVEFTIRQGLNRLFQAVSGPNPDK